MPPVLVNINGRWVPAQTGVAPPQQMQAAGMPSFVNGLRVPLAGPRGESFAPMIEPVRMSLREPEPEISAFDPRADQMGAESDGLGLFAGSLNDIAPSAAPAAATGAPGVPAASTASKDRLAALTERYLQPPDPTADFFKNLMAFGGAALAAGSRRGAGTASALGEGALAALNQSQQNERRGIQNALFAEQLIDKATARTTKEQQQAALANIQTAINTGQVDPNTTEGKRKLATMLLPISPAEALKMAAPEPIKVDANQSLYNPITNQVVFTAPQKPPENMQWNAQTGQFEFVPGYIMGQGALTRAREAAAFPFKSPIPVPEGGSVVWPAMGGGVPAFSAAVQGQGGPTAPPGSVPSAPVALAPPVAPRAAAPAAPAPGPVAAAPATAAAPGAPPAAPVPQMVNVPGVGRVLQMPKPPLGKEAQKQTEEAMLADSDILQQVSGIQQRFKPEYQTVGTRIGMEWSAFKEKFDKGALSPEQRASLDDYTKYRSDAAQMFSNVLKNLSGAAVTPAEMKRAEGWLPNPGTGIFDGDSPTQLQSKIERFTNFTQMALAKKAYIKERGLSINDVSIDQMPTIMNSVGRQAEQQFIADGMSPEEARAAAVQAVARRFGLLPR